jgi:hypothetical protein
VIAEIKTKRYVACPREGCGGKFWVEHLLDGSERFFSAGHKFGPWYCDEAHCDVVMDGVITVEGIDVTWSKRDHKRGIALLKFGDSFVTYEEHRLHDPKVDDSYDYFFHSHQCPGNLVRHCLDVYIGGMRDIHGQIRYVASVEDTPEVRKKLDGVNNLDELLAVFGTDGSLPPTMWPPENEGLIPWLAEMRRRTVQTDDAPPSKEGN